MTTITRNGNDGSGSVAGLMQGDVPPQGRFRLFWVSLLSAVIGAGAGVLAFFLTT